MTFYLKRLLKLAKHLEKNRVLDKFDFKIVFKRSHCGTSGCAMGELPYCFPRQWKSKDASRDVPCLKNKKINHWHISEAVKEFVFKPVPCGL